VLSWRRLAFVISIVVLTTIITVTCDVAASGRVQYQARDNAMINGACGFRVFNDASPDRCAAVQCVALLLLLLLLVVVVVRDPFSQYMR